MKKLLAAMFVALLMVGCGEDKSETPVDFNESAEGKPFTIPGLSMEMLWCRPGTFTMGVPDEVLTLPEFAIGEPQREVTLTKGFWLGKYEVKQAQWEEVMGTNPSRSKGANLPVGRVSWNDAMAFCAKLTERELTGGRLPEGWVFDLPTEAQWEYACRAGTTTIFPWGDTASSSQANFNGTRLVDEAEVATGTKIGQTTDVGSYAANPWGFHGMHGNDAEWTADWYWDYYWDENKPYGGYPTDPVTDPAGPAEMDKDSGFARVTRGGPYEKNFHAPGHCGWGLGFRLALRFVGKLQGELARERAAWARERDEEERKRAEQETKRIAKSIGLHDYKIIAEAIDSEKLEWRGKEGEKLYYVPNQQTPYTGWSKKMWFNGLIKSVSQYKNGKLNGLVTEWYDHMPMKSKSAWKDGKMVGDTFYYYNGQKGSENTWKNDKLITTVAWKPNGDKCPVTNVVNGNGVWVWYNDDGTEELRQTYKDGERVRD